MQNDFIVKKCSDFTFNKYLIPSFQEVCKKKMWINAYDANIYTVENVR